MKIAAQIATVSSRQYFFLSLRQSWINILPHFCISFHVSLVQYEYGRGLWFNWEVSTDSADPSSFHKHWLYRSDRNTQKVVCRVWPLFRNAQVIFRKLAHEISNLKSPSGNFEWRESGWEKLKTPTPFNVELRASDPCTKRLHLYAHPIPDALEPAPKRKHKNGICSEVGEKRLQDIELPLLLACSFRFNPFHLSCN